MVCLVSVASSRRRALLLALGLAAGPALADGPALPRIEDVRAAAQTAADEAARASAAATAAMAAASAEAAVRAAEVAAEAAKAAAAAAERAAALLEAFEAAATPPASGKK